MKTQFWKWLFLLPILCTFYEDGGDGGGDGGSGGDGGGSGDEGSNGDGGGDKTLLNGGAGSGGGDGGGSDTGGSGGGENKPFGLGSIYSGESGAINPESLENLPEEYADLKPLFGKYKTEKDFIQGIKNLQYLAGKKGMDVLPDDAPQALKDEQAALLRKINRVPEKPEDYGIKKPDDLPEGVDWNDDQVNNFLSVLHKHNASPALVQELVNMDLERAANASQAQASEVDAHFESEMEELKKAWGSKFDEKANLAQRGAAALGLDVNDPIFRNHKVAVAMARVAEMVSEDRLPSGPGDAGGGMNDRAKALDIVNNPNNPLHAAYHDAEHPQHEEAVRTRSSLNQRWIERQRKS